MRIRWRLMEPKAAPFSRHQSVRFVEDNGINVCLAPPHVCLSYGISGPSDSRIITWSLHFAYIYILYMYICIVCVCVCTRRISMRSLSRARILWRAFVSAHTFCNLPPCTLCESKLMPPACVLHPVPAGTSILIADKIRDYPGNMFHDCKRKSINKHYYVFLS